MASVLQTRLRESLREELGGTYSVSASANYTKIPRTEFNVSIRFGSAPDRMEALAARVFEEIARLSSEGPEADEVADVREAFLRDFETNMRDNGYVMNQLAFKYQYGEPPASILDPPQYYEKLSAPMVLEAAKLYLNTSRYVRVTLFPEG
jgi:zinc protease